MTVAQIKLGVAWAIWIGQQIAPRTETKFDDKGVVLLQKLYEMDALLAILVQVLGGDTDPPTAGLSADEVATLRELQADKSTMALLSYSAHEIVQE